MAAAADPKKIALVLTGAGSGNESRSRWKPARAIPGASLGKLSHTLPAQALLGNVALVSNYGPEETANAAKKAAKNPGAGSSRYRFASWKMSGDAFTISPDRRFGPLLWAMYSLSDSRTPEGWVMKIQRADRPARSRRQPDGGTARAARRCVASAGRGAARSRRVGRDVPHSAVGRENATPYKIVYREKHRDGTVTADEFTGTILPNPAGRPLRVAAMTCQNDYAFPYEPVARNVAKLKPDLVFFSGDQIYEGHGGFGIIREPAGPAILNYLRKFYQFGWAFRDVMRHAPRSASPTITMCSKGNIWGRGRRQDDQSRGRSRCVLERRLRRTRAHGERRASDQRLAPSPIRMTRNRVCRTSASIMVTWFMAA